MTRVVTALVVAHAIVNLAHGIAHWNLHVLLSSAQTMFVTIVIVVSPILAAVFLYTKFARHGAALLAASMFGSFLFATYFHYVAITPDHVAHLPAGALQWLFRLTAFFLELLQLAGTGIGIWALRKLSGPEVTS